MLKNTSILKIYPHQKKKIGKFKSEEQKKSFKMSGLNPRMTENESGFLLSQLIFLWTSEKFLLCCPHCASKENKTKNIQETKNTREKSYSDERIDYKTPDCTIVCIL